MKLEKGHLYRTEDGDVIECLQNLPKEQTEKEFGEELVSRCRYIHVGKGHGSLFGKTQTWYTESGKWVKYPGGIHDVVEALGKDEAAKARASESEVHE